MAGNWGYSPVCRESPPYPSSRRRESRGRKRGWCTVLFNAFLQKKVWTQVMKGGNTAAFYAAEGTLPKSRMQVAMHPDVSELVWRFGRWHHHVDYKPFRSLPLILKDGIKVPTKTDDYGMALIAL